MHISVTIRLVTTETTYAFQHKVTYFILQYMTYERIAKLFSFGTHVESEYLPAYQMFDVARKFFESIDGLLFAFSPHYNF